MSLFGALRKPKNFAERIHQVAAKAGVKVVEASDSLVVTLFVFADGRTQKVFLAPVGELQGHTIVDVWSVAAEVSGYFDERLAVRLLRENGNHKVGYWGIESIGDQTYLGCHHALLLETLDPEEFHVVVYTVAVQADELEKELAAGEDRF